MHVSPVPLFTTYTVPAMQKPDHRFRRSYANGAHKHGRPKLPQPPITVYAGEISFRLLCHVFSIGGVIGHSGSVVKQLEQETATRISVQEPVTDCVERVIVVTGSESLNKVITLKGEEEEECEVSNAQDGLIRVFERVLEVEAVSEGDAAGASCCCRLLAYASQIGAIMGKGGRIIAKIRKDCGVKICILGAKHVPACASPGEQLIHITGGVLAVKRALFAVSRCLLDCPPSDKVSIVVSRPVETAPSGTFPDPHAEFFPHLSSLSLPLLENSIDCAWSGHSLPRDDDRVPSSDVEGTQLEVVFRLLCSTGTVGGVIGKGGTIVRTLQNESGASINVAAPVAKCDERVVTISALENPESLYSPAQNAAIRVFARCVEVGIEKGLLTGSRKVDTVTVRLLIASNLADCLTGEGGSAVSEIIEVTGADIRIFRGDELPDCALENDEVVQITGEYKNVQNALFHVTGRLRNNYFPSKVLKGAGSRSYSSSTIPDISPFGRRRETTSPAPHQSLGHSPNFNQETIMRGMNHLSLSHNFGGPPSSRLQPSQTTGRGNISATTDSGSGLTTYRGGLELGSGSKYAVVTNTTVEVVVPEHIFGSVCGEDGSNLDRIRQISGAKVVVHDTFPGKNERMVIISGAPDQTLAAQSLLQAFILAA